MDLRHLYTPFFINAVAKTLIANIEIHKDVIGNGGQNETKRLVKRRRLMHVWCLGAD